MTKKCKNCGEGFTPKYRTTERFCSFRCANSFTKEHAKDRREEKRRSIKKETTKQARLNRKYSQKRRRFLERPENKYCAVFPRALATEVHHKMGRQGYADQWAEKNDVPLVVDERHFLAVCRKGHELIEKSPAWAKERGFTVSRLSKKS